MKQVSNANGAFRSSEVQVGNPCDARAEYSYSRCTVHPLSKGMTPTVQNTVRGTQILIVTLH